MKKIFYTFIKKIILRDFFQINLTSVEKRIAENAVRKKYSQAFLEAFLSGILIFPAILFLKTEILISILIPLTMVSGTAWFAISLSNVRKKFEKFGASLTENLFSGFLSSIVILLLLTFFSLNSEIFSSLFFLKNFFWIRIISGILGFLVVTNLIYKIIIGSIKYDINDAMLTGQSELAERYFRRELSFLYRTANILKSGKNLEIANYHLGMVFYEIFSFIKLHFKNKKINNAKLDKLIFDSKNLKESPLVSQKKADQLSLDFIKNFLSYCHNLEDERVYNDFMDIKNEIKCIEKNGEPQKLVDTRFAIIFEKIAEMFENQGETLFYKKNNI